MTNTENALKKRENGGTIEKIIKEAREQKYGTTIIVSGAAKEEAKRLCDLGYGIQKNAKTRRQ